MKKVVVGLLFGGRSGEHEVSLRSASAVAQNLDDTKYEIIPIGIAKDGTWYGPIAIEDIISFTPENYKGSEVTILPQPNNKLLLNINDFSKSIKLDVVFPIMHGTFGEDGTIQGLLELADIPYVGAGVLGSSAGMDKIVMKKIFADSKLPQVKFAQVLRKEIEEDIEKVLNYIQKNFTLPVFIKPANLGSSVGISKVKKFEELEASLLEAAKYDRKLIIEEGLEVREIEVSVLGNDNPRASIAGEIIPCNDFYDYKAKYVDDKSILKIPAEIDETTMKKIQQLAIEAYKAIDCAGLGRVDFFICKKTGKILLNEINTLPGFTSISMYPKLWEKSGLSMPELLDQLINLAFTRYNEKSKNLTNFSS